MPAENYQNKYNMVFHENANCTVMNDVQFHQPVTIVSGDKTFLNETQMPSSAAEEVAGDDKVHDDEGNPLKRYIPDKEDLEYVVEYARVCKSPRDINNCIVLPLKKKGYKEVLLTNPPFLNVLIPYLTNYESVKNAESISRALRK